MSTRFCRIAAFAVYFVFSLPAMAASTPYTTDPDLNGGLYLVDDFGLSGSTVGKKVAPLGNGNVLVAAVVPSEHFSTSNTALGLTMYDRNGGALPFSNPGLYSWQDGYDVVLDEDPMRHSPYVVDDIKDVQVYGDYIFVLADVEENGQFAAEIAMFGTDGHFIFRVLQPGPGSGAAQRDITAGGLAVYRTISPAVTIHVAEAGTEILNGNERAFFDNYAVDAVHGTLLESLTHRVYPNPAGLCPASVNCELAGIAMARQFSFSQAPTLYLGGSQQTASGDWYFMAMAVDAGGTPVGSFGTGGGVSIPFNVLTSNNEKATAILADTTLGEPHSGLLYLVGNVAQTCATGIGIVALYNTGEEKNDFGPNADGRVLVGGSDVDVSTCLSTIQHSELAIAATLVQGRAVAIAGSTTYRKSAAPCFLNPCPELNVDGELTVVDAVTGSLESFASYPYRTYAGGPRAMHSELSGVIATENGTFTATGDVRNFQSSVGAAPGTQAIATLRFRIADTLFADDFEP